MIKLRNIEKVYRTTTLETLALSEFSMDVNHGEFVSVMGPSGCGKSTLLNIIGLLDTPTKGNVELDGKDVSHNNDKSIAQFRNSMIGFVFQSFHLISDLSVVDNVEIPLIYRKMSGSARRKTALEALERVGLKSRVNHYPSQLSGGQQQRVAIARATVGNPKILLADEPTGNLDSTMGDEIVGILKSLNEVEKTTVVMVTHDMHFAEMTNRIVRLFDGRRVN